jgi:acetyl esterase
VVTAEFDVLRDEGEAYAARLSKAGTETTLRRYDGVIHGFFHLRSIFDDAQTAMSDIASVIKQHFA